jgi:hypothetical protein
MTKDNYPSSKTQQLARQLAEPIRVKMSTIVNRLVWQPQSVRLAASRLRKGGVDVAMSRSVRSGETVYSIGNAKPTEA